MTIFSRKPKQPDLGDYFIRKTGLAQIYNKMLAYNARVPVSWDDLTDQWCDGFADFLKGEVSKSSAATYFAVIRNFLSAARKAGYNFPAQNYKELLTSKKDKTVKTYLNLDELKRLEEYEPQNETERSVRANFLISAYTGMRKSDFCKITRDNVDEEGNLIYISEKTNTKAALPLKPLVWELLAIPRKEVTLTTYINTLRRMCKACCIDSLVQVIHGGIKRSGEKWEFVSSHTGRISFATNLHLLGLDIFTISRMMGHSDSKMTESYICAEKRELPDTVKIYFK